MSVPVVCRFAPSPTGYLHIGGARTALFNWLYARHMDGKLVLRIEDTDRARSSQEAVDAILDGLTWLGLAWDGEPISQFARAERHREVVEHLLATGNAYKCYMSAEELAEEREKAKAAGTSFQYDGRWRDRDPAEAPEGVDPVIRLKTPQSGETVVDDKVQGSVSFPNKDLDDFVILRSDGTPTYMLSVVVDDHDMSVSHIVRGDDHFTNAARQTLIYQALGWDVPVMAHIPLIHGPDGAKLSKRHGALGIEAYRDMGYLPAALRNYLARLGWSHGDDEIFSTGQMVEWFDLDSLNKAPARIDFKKLEAVNAHYIREAGDGELYDMLDEWIVPADRKDRFAERRDWLVAAMPLLKQRAKTLVDLYESAGFLLADRPLEPDEKARKVMDDEARKLVAEVIDGFAGVDSWARDGLEAVVNRIAEEKSLKFGKVAQPLRVALTGTTASPSVFDILTILGRDEATGRLRDSLT